MNNNQEGYWHENNKEIILFLGHEKCNNSIRDMVLASRAITKQTSIFRNWTETSFPLESTAPRLPCMFKGTDSYQQSSSASQQKPALRTISSGCTLLLLKTPLLLCLQDCRIKATTARKHHLVPERTTVSTSPPYSPVSSLTAVLHSTDLGPTSDRKLKYLSPSGASYGTLPQASSKPSS